ncbi:protein-methionine-sulfoxide reductase catalytic subunit MsrP [Roseibium limicola]|uniref:Protein-methionine-sulfoxide reductase catalytic subunit MsrP n=1 Tax=Roseibium limicola TaxID=2816037 RepID=A0A939EJK8_9HYPH|nr:protein-methionine-sulfoxide reductase catalytic subunit MsrP [Roseibium limicola]MBO0343784.1 protein-methionine-sulfoxide reductase catalytic subunit MsrP [Roseibium limicola]
MNVIQKPSWQIPESEATPEHVFHNRRSFMKGAAAGLLGVGAFGAGIGFTPRRGLAAEDPSAGLYPVPRNEGFTLDREITPEGITSQYNNFYEFGTHKEIYRAAQALETRPWTVTIDGLADNPMTLDMDDLLKKMPLEERLYRHRCVEAWSMAVPWSGFPLAELVKMASPKASAKYLRFETFMDPEMAPGQTQGWYPWPYVEGLTLAEATNELAFMATGIYGKPLQKQYGAPLRLALPWKYGFKSIKSIVRLSFVEEQPVGMWEAIQASEYGFWANVNPGVPHPRWSQASERLLGTSERRDTLMFNGYAEQVTALYPEWKTDMSLYR